MSLFDVGVVRTTPSAALVLEGSPDSADWEGGTSFLGDILQVIGKKLPKAAPGRMNKGIQSHVFEISDGGYIYLNCT